MAFSSSFLTSVRTLATSAARNQLIKPPIQVFGLDGRYATALFSAASKEKQLESVEKELIKLQGTLKTDKILREFLFNPTIQKRVKMTAITSICKKISFSPVSEKFLVLLAENGRLKNLTAIINAFEIIMAAHRGDLPVEITSAKPLEESVKQELLGVLGKFTKKGENVIIRWKTDPLIVGGLVVSIGDKYVDMSIASKVKKYSDLLKSTV